jgi:hypothetical protein
VICVPLSLISRTS